MHQIAKKQKVSVFAKPLEAVGNRQKVAVVAVQVRSDEQLSVPRKA